MASNRTPLDALITEKTLAALSIRHNDAIIDHLLTEGDEGLPLKNVCARVHENLARDIDEICGVLGISKRRFLETAMIEAVQRAGQIMQDEGLLDYLSGKSSAPETLPGEQAQEGN